MIPWYKKWYLVDEIETKTILEKELVLIKMKQYFDPDKPDIDQYGKRQRRPEYHFNLNERTETFSLRKKSVGWNENRERNSFIAHGKISGNEQGTGLKVNASIPIYLIILVLVLLRIAYVQSAYLFLLLIIPVGIAYFWKRNLLKEELLNVDVEINKCLKS